MIEPWQIPVLAMTLIVLPPSLHWFVGWIRGRTRTGDPAPAPVVDEGARRERRRRRERWRTSTLALMTLVLLGVFVAALGSEAATVLTSVASAVATLVSSAMTLQAFVALRDVSREPSPEPPADRTSSQP